MDRRDVLAASVAVAGGILLPDGAVARSRRARPVPAGIPGMADPSDVLPISIAVQDPSRILFDQGWLFHPGDIVPPPPDGHNETYLRAKAGNAAGAAAPDFDDGDWQQISLPHDWASFQPYVETANVSQGYRKRGIGWYRRTFRLDPADRGRFIEVQLGGIATHATVWVNGNVVAHNWSGYNSLYLDITPFARFGDEQNVIAVRVDADAAEGWWYEGAGLYRHAWLTVRAPVSIATDGVHCDPRRGTDGRWSVPVAVTIASIADAAAPVDIVATLRDPAGDVLARARTQALSATPDGIVAGLTLDAGTPALWSIERPVLHEVHVALERDGSVVDERRIPIGFRTIRFDPARGFFLNDAPVKLKGVCLHQDHAGVGTALPDALVAWRLSRLKAMGCNAIRCSHNAPAAELLDLCDRMGFVVMAENRNFNPSPDYMAQLEWMVRRDRNHPSVILWSILNEEPMQSTDAGVEMARRMVAHVRRLDDGRPVTGAMNGAFFDPVNVSSVIDVVGFNYYQSDYDRYHALHPDRCITSSEDTSAFETRGAFADDARGHVFTSYDVRAADWGATHRASWKAIAERPFVAGGFVWTGFDYHGEPAPYAWPTVSSYFGILDLCGFPKTAFDIRRAQWVDDEPVVSINPHWTWPGRDGKPIELLVMSNAERVVLLLNGRMIGEQAVDRIMGNGWTVPYAPGRIEALAMRGGRIVARAAWETAGPPVALRLTPARTVMAGDGIDAQPITIDAVDARGRHVPTANLPTSFTVTGARLLGVGNGDPNSHESEKAPARSLFNGLAQMIVQADEGAGGIVVQARADGLTPARIGIDRIAVAPPARVAVTQPLAVIGGWRQSPPFAARPAPDLAPEDGDNNSWAFIRPGTPLPPGTRTEWRIYRTVWTPRRRTAARGGTLRFAGVAGDVELWIDGARAVVRTDPATAPIEAPIGQGAGPHRIALLVRAVPGRPSGLTGAVTVMDR